MLEIRYYTFVGVRRRWPLTGNVTHETFDKFKGIREVVIHLSVHLRDRRWHTNRQTFSAVPSGRLFILPTMATSQHY